MPRDHQAIRAIKERLGIAELVGRYVSLRRVGTRYMAPCPFHAETRPSFFVNEEDGSFYCFGCQASGDIFDFYSRMNGTSFGEALEQLAAETGVELASAPRAEGDDGRGQRRSLYAMNELAATHFRQNLAGEKGAEARAYLAGRGVDREMSERFGLGFAPKAWHDLCDALNRAGFANGLAREAGLCGISAAGRAYDRFRGRLIFPIISLAGQNVAFGGRVLPGADENEAKYINSQETPVYKKGEHLFGLNMARRPIAAAGIALLTEGYMDVLTLHQFGFANACGVLGTALTARQCRRLAGFTSTVGLVFDGDNAGRKASLRSAEMLLCLGLNVRVVALPDGEDIDSFLRGQGPEAFAALVENARDGLAYCMGRLRGQSPREAVAWARSFIAGIEVPELRAPMTDTVCRELGLDRAALDENADRLRARATRREAARKPLPRLGMREAQILIFTARYPERAPELRDMGAELALTSGEGRDFFRKVLELGPQGAPAGLDERWREFWYAQRGPQAAPRDNADMELAFLRGELEKFYAGAQNASLLAALRSNAGSGDFQTDLDYLRALKETLEKGHDQP